MLEKKKLFFFNWSVHSLLHFSIIKFVEFKCGRGHSFRTIFPITVFVLIGLRPGQQCRCKKVQLIKGNVSLAVNLHEQMTKRACQMTKRTWQMTGYIHNGDLHQDSKFD